MRAYKHLKVVIWQCFNGY